jgi:hypothetical protein
LALHSLDPSKDTWEVLQAANGLGDDRPCINKIAVAIWDVIKMGRGREWGRGVMNTSPRHPVPLLVSSQSSVRVSESSADGDSQYTCSMRKKHTRAMLSA